MKFFIIFILISSVFANPVKDMYIFDKPSFVGSVIQFEKKFNKKLIIKDSYEAFSEGEASIKSSKCIKNKITIETKIPIFKIMILEDKEKNKIIGKSVLPISNDVKRSLKNCN